MSSDNARVVIENVCLIVVEQFTYEPLTKHQKPHVDIFNLGEVIQGQILIIFKFNPQVYRSLIPEGVYALNGNDVISFFRSAANRVNTAAAVTDFAITK